MVNMSALPQLKPIKISDLQQRYTRAHITQNYDRIAHGVVITKAEQTADAPFQHDIISRARAHHLNNPKAIVSHWAAAAYAGLTYCDTACRIRAPYIPLTIATSPASKTRSHCYMDP